MSSAASSQSPQLMMPHGLAHQIDMASLLPAARRDFSEKQLEQIRKTAKVVSSEPWRLFDAQSWLETLRDENVRQVVRKPPPLEMVLAIGACAEPGTLPDFSDLIIPDDPLPRVVRVAAKKILKRPASAAAACGRSRPRKRPASRMEGDDPGEDAAAPAAEVDEGGGDEGEGDEGEGDEPVLRRPAAADSAVDEGDPPVLRRPAASAPCTQQVHWRFWLFSNFL